MPPRRPFFVLLLTLFFLAASAQARTTPLTPTPRRALLRGKRVTADRSKISKNVADGVGSPSMPNVGARSRPPAGAFAGASGSRRLRGAAEIADAGEQAGVARAGKSPAAELTAANTHSQTHS